jgi:hypothetical protein
MVDSIDGVHILQNKAIYSIHKINKKLRRLTGDKTKKYRRSQKTKITAALVADITAAVKLDRRKTIRLIGLVLNVLLRTFFTQYNSKI